MTTPSMAEHISATLQALADELPGLSEEEAAKVVVPHELARLAVANGCIVSDRDELPSGLIPAERLALSVARSHLKRGENPGVNVTTVLLLTVDRLNAVLVGRTDAATSAASAALSSLADDLADVGYTEAAELAREASRAPGARL